MAQKRPKISQAVYIENHAGAAAISASASVATRRLDGYS